MDKNLKDILIKADAALQEGDESTAEALFKSALAQDSELASAHYALGTMAFQRRDFQAALTALNKAAELEPEAVDIAFNFASCLATVGDRLGALIQLQRATKHCQDDPVFVPRIAEMSIRLGEPAAAVTLLSRLGKLLPADQIILATAQGQLGNWREAVSILKWLNDAVPRDAEVADKLATAAGKLRDYPTAITAYGRYLQLVKPTALDYLRYADLLLIAQNADRCDQALDIAIDMGEDSPEVHILKARTARLKGDYEQVQKSLAMALELQPNHGQAWAIKAELAEPAELDAFVTELKTQLDNKQEITKLNDRHQALLHYAMADMCDRNAMYEAASAALNDANEVQLAVQEMAKGDYKSEDIEKLVNRTIEEFNPAVFYADSAATEVGDIKPSGINPRPIFIVGMPRSGTTLVERILGQNNDVFSAGEQEALEFVSVDFRHQIKLGNLPQPGEVSTEQWSALHDMYFDKLPEISKPIFTDKMPHNFRSVGLILKMFPEAKIIQLHRSIQDVCLSVYSHPFGPGHNYANRIEDIAHFYSESERLMNHWSSIGDPRLLDLNYEDLVQSPEQYAKQLVEFCGFDWDQNYLEFHKSVNPSFTFSEIQVREPIASKRVERWRNYAEYLPELTSL